jgi:hypothetical protein
MLKSGLLKFRIFLWKTLMLKFIFLSSFHSNFTSEMQNENIIKGQGAQRNVINRFDRYTFEPEDDDFETVKTSFTEVFPKALSIR